MSESSMHPVSREVIEGKLLAALNDERKVAVVLGEDELVLLLNALGSAADNAQTKREADRFDEFQQDLRKLRKAFRK